MPGSGENNMRHLLILFCLTSFSAVAAPLLAPPPATKFAVELSDGTRLVGTPVIQTLKLRTSSGDLDVKVSQISTVEIADADGKAEVTLENGDRISGKLVVGTLDLDTTLGRARVAAGKIRRISSGAGSNMAGLVMYYTFDKATEDGHVLDAVKKNGPAKLHNASIVGGGKKNGAVQLEGDGSYVTFPDENLPMKNSPRTVALWVKSSRSSRRQIVFVYGRLAHGGVFGLCNYTNERVLAVVEWFILPPSSHHGRVPVTNGDWHHVALVYDGQRTAKLYIDGQLDIKVTRSYATEPGGAGSISIDAADHGFEGKVDEFMVFNKALNEAEVKSLYQSQK